MAYERLHDLFTPVGRLINAIGDAPDDTTVAGFIEPRRALVDAGMLTSFEDAVRPHARRLADHVDGMGRRGVNRI
jgi:hypothetical protein